MSRQKFQTELPAKPHSKNGRLNRTIPTDTGHKIGAMFGNRTPIAPRTKEEATRMQHVGVNKRRFGSSRSAVLQNHQDRANLE